MYLLLTEHFAMCNREYKPARNIVCTLKGVYNENMKKQYLFSESQKWSNIESSGADDNYSWKGKKRDYPRNGLEVVVSMLPL